MLNAIFNSVFHFQFILYHYQINLSRTQRLLTYLKINTRPGWLTSVISAPGGREWKQENLEFKASPGKVIETLSQKQNIVQALVAHACNSCYLGG
jgi:hypothetical protein